MASYPRGGNQSSFEPAEPRVAEPEQAYVVRLTPAVHSRLLEFFNRTENTGLRESDVIENLLSASHPNVTVTPRMQSYSPPVTRRRGLVTTLPLPQSAPRRVTTRYITGNDYDSDSDDDDEEGGVEDDEEGDEEMDEGEDEDEEGVEVEIDEDDVLEDVDEELNYGDEYSYVYEEVVVDSGTAPPALMSPPRQPGANNYYYSGITRSEPRKRIVPLPSQERRYSTRSGSSPRSQKKQSHPERKGVGTGKQKPWTTNLRRFLYDVIVKWQRDGLLHCRECDRWMSVVHKSCGLRAGNALDHVCRHIGKPMYACRLCPHQTVAQVQMRKHLKQAHKRTNDFDDLTDSFYSELAERASRCFDYTDIGEPPIQHQRKLLTCKKKPGEAGVGKRFLDLEMDVDMSPVRRFIYELITKWNKENALYCRQCNRWVRVGIESPWAQAQAALAHVCGHYGKAVYVCLICNERTITSCQMIRHIRHVHQTISRGNCSEEIDDPAELKNVAAKCFDWEEGTGPPAISEDAPFLKKKRPAKEERIKPSRRPGSCRLDVLELARSLIQKYAPNARSMKCAECAMACSVKTAKGYRPEGLFDHVLKHIDKDAYSCPKCDKTSKKKDTMRVHMVVHKDTQPTDYIDNTAVIREEIFEMMKKCFDREYIPNEAGSAI